MALQRVRFQTLRTNGMQEFTMDMMLRTINVDLDSIGYDRQQQRWVK